MKLLLIGFHKYDDNMYPHLRCFIDQISARTDLAYFHFRERGYFPQTMMQQKSRKASWSIAVRAMRSSVIDSLKLWRHYRNYDTIIAIDHYAYAIASRVFREKKVIFWRHDVISHDSVIFNHPIVQAFMKACSKALLRNGRVIIQDEDRLNLLKESLRINDHELDVVYMPVSLERTGITKRELSSSGRPRLIQSGGIGAYRCSDQLLAHYQSNSDSYRLYFHGFIFEEIKNQLAKSHVQPMVSSRIVSPKLIYQLNDYCDIGFVCYADEENKNFFLVAHASGQLVEFLRVGMPVIVMGKNNLPRFVEEQGIGIGIKDVSEMNRAVETIAQNYQIYSQNCFLCFNRYFDIEKHVLRIIGWL
jgi:glycosyltransferase involved in cell wall biosynthesis